MPARRAWSQLILLIGLFMLARQVASCWVFTVDDSYITYTYSRNLAAGHGPTWFPGGPPVEGYTTFLWMVIMAVPYLLGLEPLLFAKIFSLLTTVLTLGVIFLFARRLQRWWGVGEDDLLPLVAVSIFAALYFTAVHTVSGMETALFTCLVSAVFYALSLCAEKPTPRRLAAFALVGLLAGLTRPEGNFVVLVGAGTLWALQPPPERSRLIRGLLLYLLPAVLYYAWRYHYYGHLFPLPFYVKTVTGHFAGLPEVASYLKSLALPLLAVALPGLLANADRRLLPAVIPALGLVAFFVIPQHQMGYEVRYLYPLTPLLVTLAAVGFGQTLRLLTPWWQSLTRCRRALTCTFVAVLLLVVGRGYFVDGLFETLAIKRGYGRHLIQTHVALGRYLHDFPGPGPRPLVGFNDAGAIPYFSGWRGLDFWGLNDPWIALHGKGEPAYSDEILRRQPDLVILGSRSPSQYEPTFFWEQGLFDRCLKSGYRCVKVGTWCPEVYYLWLLARPGTPVADYVSRWRQKLAPETLKQGSQLPAGG